MPNFTPTYTLEQVKQLFTRRHKAPKGDCSTCDAARAKGTDYHPSHDASPQCESGQHNHCSCDTCF